MKPIFLSPGNWISSISLAILCNLFMSDIAFSQSQEEGTCDGAVISGVPRVQVCTEVSNAFLDVQSAKDQLDTIASEDAKKILVPVYLDEKDFTNCRNNLSQIPNDSSENIAFHRLFDMLVDFCALGNEIEDIGPAEEAIVRQVAATNTRAAIQAQSILRLVFDEDFERIPEEAPSSKSQHSENSDEVMMPNGEFRIYPNPASNDLEISLPIAYSEFEKGSFSMYNMRGTEVKNQEIDLEKVNISIDVSDLTYGIYIYTLRIEGRLYEKGKVSVIK